MALFRISHNIYILDCVLSEDALMWRRGTWSATTDEAGQTGTVKKLKVKGHGEHKGPSEARDEGMKVIFVM